MNEETLNIFDRILVEDFEIHDSLHLVASYNRPYIQKLLSYPVIDANKPDEVLEGTSQVHTDRNKLWIAIDILLQNGANPDEIYLLDIMIKPRNGEGQVFGMCAKGAHKTVGVRVDSWTSA
jgi:hypothetical protein